MSDSATFSKQSPYRGLNSRRWQIYQRVIWVMRWLDYAAKLGFDGMAKRRVWKYSSRCIIDSLVWMVDGRKSSVDYDRGTLAPSLSRL